MSMSAGREHRTHQVAKTIHDELLRRRGEVRMWDVCWEVAKLVLFKLDINSLERLAGARAIRQLVNDHRRAHPKEPIPILTAERYADDIEMQRRSLS